MVSPMHCNAILLRHPRGRNSLCKIAHNKGIRCKSGLNLGVDSGLSEPGLEALEDGHNDLQLGFRQLAVLRPGVWGWGGHYY